MDRGAAIAWMSLNCHKAWGGCFDTLGDAGQRSVSAKGGEVVKHVVRLRYTEEAADQLYVDYCTGLSGRSSKDSKLDGFMRLLRKQRSEAQQSKHAGDLQPGYYAFKRKNVVDEKTRIVVAMVPGPEWFRKETQGPCDSKSGVDLLVFNEAALVRTWLPRNPEPKQVGMGALRPATDMEIDGFKIERDRIAPTLELVAEPGSY